MSTMHDTTKLVQYKPRMYPVIESSLPMYVATELQSISTALNQCVVALKALEARLVAGNL